MRTYHKPIFGDVISLDHIDIKTTIAGVPLIDKDAARILLAGVDSAENSIKSIGIEPPRFPVYIPALDEIVLQTSAKTQFHFPVDKPSVLMGHGHSTKNGWWFFDGSSVSDVVTRLQQAGKPVDLIISCNPAGYFLQDETIFYSLKNNRIGAFPQACYNSQTSELTLTLVYDILGNLQNIPLKIRTSLLEHLETYLVRESLWGDERRKFNDNQALAKKMNEKLGRTYEREQYIPRPFLPADVDIIREQLATDFANYHVGRTRQQ